MDRVNANQATIRRTLSRRLKWQFRVLQNVLEGRSTTYRVSNMFCALFTCLELPSQRKVEILIEELDEGDGV
jgi:hypothetical protein